MKISKSGALIGKVAKKLHYIMAMLIKKLLINRSITGVVMMENRTLHVAL